MKEQTPDYVEKGNFAREKVKQFRAWNKKEIESGIPEDKRSKLRDLDMDHKNALRTVERYTEGLSESNIKLIYQELALEGLFTGDESRNLILRRREVHNKLYPLLKDELNKLNHKTAEDFSTEEDYFNYLTKYINPKTELTPIQEYAEKVHYVEEQGNDSADAFVKSILEAAQQPEPSPLIQQTRDQYSDTKRYSMPSSHRTTLIEILGSVDDYHAFLKRLRAEYNEQLQLEMILEEIRYAGKQPEPLTLEGLEEMYDEILRLDKK